jgi:hypothetical protein
MRCKKQFKKLIKSIREEKFNKGWLSYNKNIAGDIKDDSVEPKKNESPNEYVPRLLDRINKIFYGSKS